jgi:hypothetical protein
MLIEPETFDITLLLFSLAYLGTGLLFSGFAAPKKARNLPPLKTQGVQLVAQDAIAHSIQGDNC